MAVMEEWKSLARKGGKPGMVGGGEGVLFCIGKIFKVSLAFLSYENNIF